MMMYATLKWFRKIKRKNVYIKRCCKMFFKNMTRSIHIFTVFKIKGYKFEHK